MTDVITIPWLSFYFWLFMAPYVTSLGHVRRDVTLMAQWHPTLSAFPVKNFWLDRARELGKGSLFLQIAITYRIEIHIYWCSMISSVTCPGLDLDWVKASGSYLGLDPQTKLMVRLALTPQTPNTMVATVLFYDHFLTKLMAKKRKPDFQVIDLTWKVTVDPRP